MIPVCPDRLWNYKTEGKEMRVVIDMQGAQTPFSSGRGVGRYTREMVKAFIRVCSKQDEIFLALNGCYEEACNSLIKEFEKLLPRDRIKVWQWYPVQEPACLKGVAQTTPIEWYREWFLQQFRADIIWSPNFQEGFFDYNVACTAGLLKGNSLVCTTLHDVIPLIYKKDYLDGSDSRDWYYQKLKYTKQCDFVITVSKFSKEKIAELLHIPKDHIFTVYEGADKDIFYREKTGAAPKEKIILYVGGADRHKNIRNLIKAFSLLSEELKRDYKLAFVGGEPKREQAQLLRVAARYGVKKSSMAFYGYVSDHDLRRLFQTCAVFVFPSYSEGFGLPVVEAMECGAPVVAANAASLPEIVGDGRFMFDPFQPEDIADKIRCILTDSRFAQDSVENGQERAALFSWQAGGEELYRVFQLKLDRESGRGCEEDACAQERLYKEMARLCKGRGNLYCAKAAASIQDAMVLRGKRTVYIDTSAVVTEDYVTGIQRTVNGIISNLYECFADDPKTEICPVYSSPEYGYFIKSAYNGKKYVKQKQVSHTEIVQFYDGDLFLMPDLAPGFIMAKETYIRALVKRGVQVYTVLYDLIPMKYPDFFSSDFVQEYEGYLQCIAQFSGVISISRATMEDYTSWCSKKGVKFPPYFKNTFNYCGCDFTKANPTTGLVQGYEQVIKAMEAFPSFLMVSTLEPRKKQDQVLAAMERLWKKGVEANLILVGRNGWKMERFVHTLKHHEENGKRLFWLSGISDEYLNLLYQKACTVIVASLMEGYGLPMIEGAQHGKPLILRDIPVFREVAGKDAFYFTGDTAQALADALEEWLELYRKDAAPGSAGVRFVTWRQSVERLLEVVEFDKALVD